MDDIELVCVVCPDRGDECGGCGQVDDRRTGDEVRLHGTTRDNAHQRQRYVVWINSDCFCCISNKITFVSGRDFTLQTGTFNIQMASCQCFKMSN